MPVNGIFQLLIQSADRFTVRLQDFPVIGVQSVYLLLHIGQLGVDGGGNALLYRRKNGGGQKAAVAPGESLAAVIFSVAVELLAVAVPRNLPGIAAELGKRQGADRLRPEFQGKEIIVQAAQVAALLVKPAAGVVYQPCGIQAAYKIRGLQGVELSPALIKRNPANDGRMDAQGFYRIPCFTEKLLPPLRIPAGKKAAAVPAVLNGNVHGVKKGGKVGDEPVAVGAAAAYHILPHQHSQPVAVIVPALRLYFDMLAKHIEAQLLHGPDIINKCLITGRGVKAVRPVALIQDAGLHIRPVIQEDTAQAVAVGLDIAFAHGKIAFHPVIPHFQGCVIKEGIFRGPGVESRQGKYRLSVRGKGPDAPYSG